MSERRGNPFGWIALGFVVGVLTTFGTTLFLTAGDDAYEVDHERAYALQATAADDAAVMAMTSAPVSSQPAPRRLEASAPAMADPALPAQPQTQPEPQPALTAAAPESVDPQVADDAAAAGMTSRAQQ